VTLTVTDNEGATGTLVTNAAATKPPIASFTYTCGRLACAFDGSSSTDPDGSIASYEWYFGDGTSGTGAVVNHAYAAAGTYGMSLTVRDNLGISAFIQKSVTVASTLSPIASFTSTCSFLACVFDGSASVAREGTLATYRWEFGDGNYAFTARESHTYALPGTYIVTLMVRDSYGVPHELSRVLTVTATAAHIGDIDRVVTRLGSSWGATVTLTAHAENHTPLANVRVAGLWSTGPTAECVTSADGRCDVWQAQLPKQSRTVTFSVTSISGPAGYRPDRNHDPDGDSNGTTIVIKR
jgi:PKD repeat protein